jgi:hypothetical protein
MARIRASVSMWPPPIYGDECNDTFLQPRKIRLSSELRTLMRSVLTDFRRRSRVQW